MPSASRASRSPGSAVPFLTTKPPFAPTGTITAFFTACALTRPRISVRKSSRRSDHRRPPRATAPKRRCTPSTFGEYTQISYLGRGAGSSGSRCGSSLTDRYVRVQARLEQPHQQPRHRDIGRQRLLEVLLAERRPDLPQIFGVRTQHHGLPPGEAGLQHERVEAVGLGLAGPRRGERLLEAGL